MHTLPLLFTPVSKVPATGIVAATCSSHKMTTSSVGRSGGDNPTCHTSPYYRCGGDHHGTRSRLCQEDEKRFC